MPNLRCLGIYRQFAQAGFHPEVIYDIGASTSRWSSELVEVFPTAIYHLFEPLAEIVSIYQEGMQSAQIKYPRFHVHPIALGETSGTTKIAITSNPKGSTVLPVASEPSEWFPQIATVPLHSLDELLAAGIIPPAQLLKLDVQGSEDRILRGAEQVLRTAQVLQVECWLYPCYGPETAMMADIVKMLSDLGFIAVECSDPWYRENHQLCAIDLYFAQEDFCFAPRT
jgi:FkbM family methyltransferase